MRGMESGAGHDGATAEEGIVRPGVLHFDPARYSAELDAFDITEAQKQELLATLWSIMCSFVELSFSVDVCVALLGDIDLTISDAGELK